MKRNRYTTKQRSEIEHLLKQADGRCLSAGEILAHLSSPVSTATVYRHLHRLVEEGAAQTEVSASGSTVYRYCGEGGCGDHFHLRCLRCGRLVHLDCGLMAELSSHIASSHAFRLDSQKTVLYGVCGECES
ncbi:MAG: transcriptional repressor [Ruminococcaceae bacterium]|nr:transcriptional repressor [Oscillospiraceae bacterium]